MVNNDYFATDWEKYAELRARVFSDRARKAGVTVDELHEIEDMFDYMLWIKDVNPDGSFIIFPFGHDRHDSISLFGGIAHYRNLQNGDGCVLRVVSEELDEEGYHAIDFDHLTSDDIIYIKEEYL